MSDRIREAKEELNRLYNKLTDAHHRPDPVAQREKVQEVAADLRRLADRIDPDVGSDL